MAFFDQRAFIGRPSLRRSLMTLDEDQQQAFAGRVAGLDPKRFKSLYRRRAADFLSDERDNQQALSRVYQAREDERKRNLYRVQNFGRSPNEILEDF